ncbi:WYL domain-containing protein [Ruminococcus sp. CLA-AA-H200]|uniref:WYL domain-containing protein n=1 Tax=Ruminococcus turbiniformis TaxID=2881258 RepID=A0ABS8G242_9FIRM|nr:WYL domain-containing protein [Ruminococcus turbiniformis]MCC2255924.1 WYL domain-containing protein [Ruminococcus turbiniformis]
MYVKQPKKLLILNILDILRKYTDEDHRLSQKEIAEILKNEYDMKADRKAIRRNLLNLMDCGYEIEYSETIRNVPVKDKKTGAVLRDKDTGEPVMEENELWSDFYLKRQFTDGELRLLIDSLLFSRHIPYSQCKDLVEKLEDLSNIYFKSRVRYISTLPEDKTDNRQLFYNIEMLDEAISKNRKVSFRYVEYQTDKKLHEKRWPDGSIREYVITPYQMAAREGKYYLICNYDKYDDISNYRLDRIRDIRILDEPGKPFSELKWSGNRKLDLAEYMKEHVYMYSSENVHVKFRIVKPMITDVIDMFGKEVAFSDENETHVTVAVKTNERAMEQFAKNFAPDVEVLQPENLRQKVKEELERAAEVYRRI